MATGTQAAIDQTTAAAFIPTLWSMEAIVAREQALLFANLANRQFETGAIMRMGQTVHVPNISHLAARSLAYTGGGPAAAVSYETVTESNTDITVNTWEYAAIALTPAIVAQVTQDLHARYAPQMGYALQLAIDNALSALVTSITNTIGSLAVELSYEDLLRGIQYLDDANAPQTGRSICISPAQKAGFSKLDQYVSDDYSKLNADANLGMKDASMGTWLGIPAFFSTAVNGSNAAGHSNFLFQKECFALIVQMQPDTKTMFDTDVMADKYVMHQLRGQAIMRNDHGVCARGA